MIFINKIKTKNCKMLNEKTKKSILKPEKSPAINNSNKLKFNK